MQAQPEPSKTGHEQFIVWFKAQSFYTNLAFAHGDRLCDFEQSENTFRVLAVQTAWCVWQKQQKRIDELQRRNHMLNDNIKEQDRKLVYQNEVIETQAEKLLGLRDEKAEPQKQVDAALKETQHALRYVEADMRGNHEFLKMAMIRTFKSLAQTLKGGEV